MNKLPRIRFIVEYVRSKRDSDNNTYAFAIVTSTMTGNHVAFETCGTNAEIEVKRATGLPGGYPEIFTTESELSKKDWKIAKDNVGSRYMDSDKQTLAICELER